MSFALIPSIFGTVAESIMTIGVAVSSLIFFIFGRFLRDYKAPTIEFIRDLRLAISETDAKVVANTEKIEELTSQVNDQQNEISSLKSENVSLKSENEMIRGQLQLNVREIAGLRAENDRLNGKIVLQEVEIHKLRDENEQLRSSLTMIPKSVENRYESQPIQKSTFQSDSNS